ncbi:MAG TPA: S8 family serine peptidase [Casimicrobiaceae bacterium]
MSYRLALRRVGALAAGVLLIGCAAVGERAADDAESPKQLRERQVIVTLAQATPQQWEAATQALALQYALRATGSFPLRSIHVQCVVFEVPGDASVDALVERLRTDPRVESVQPNRVFEGAQAPQAGAYSSLEYASAAIRADEAHRVSTGKGVRVAVVDTGVDVDHPDLRGRFISTANFVDGGERSFATDRHGTAVAGVIGARASDARGIVGIAPDASLIAAKACWYAKPRTEKAVCSSWTLAKAIDFAIGEHAQVINLSLSGPSDALVGRLLTAAEAQGIAVVAAAAEQGASPGFPAALEPVIAVIASDANGRADPPRWVESKRALAAPGIDILTTAPRGAHDFVSGSSLAAAEVSGVVALLLEGRPDATPAELRAVLQLTKRPVAAAAGGPAASSLGLVDACAALSALLARPACA